jgi:hypothetical protein
MVMLFFTREPRKVRLDLRDSDKFTELKDEEIQVYWQKRRVV